jgi:hypothetical protein
MANFWAWAQDFPRMNKIMASKPHVSIEETTVSNDNPIKESFFGKVGKVNKRKVHDIGLPTTLPYFPQEQTPVVKRVRYRDLSDVPHIYLILSYHSEKIM